jgi:hypothetical protein
MLDAAVTDSGGPLATSDAGASESSGPPLARRESAEWTPFPEGATVLVFRDLLVGVIPYPARRTTWSLAIAGDAALLRHEASRAAGALAHLDDRADAPATWSAPIRAEYTGKVLRKEPLSIAFQIRFGARGESALPEALAMTCATKQVRVRAAGAHLLEGKKQNDDRMTPARWVPGTSESVRANRCTFGEDSRALIGHFTEALTFASKQASPGIEWAFVSSDMVVQEGGLRWLPAP